MKHPSTSHPHGDSQEASHRLGKVAFQATLHCLSGCAVGEVLGMVIGTSLGLSNGATIALSVLLALLFGYAFTVAPLLRSGMALQSAAGLALGADTISIAIMEIVDNAIMLVWPGAMNAGLGEPLFWIALAASLGMAAVAAYPANRWLISRGRGHALVHDHHRH
jgi:hypothetical protein